MTRRLFATSAVIGLCVAFGSAPGHAESLIDALTDAYQANPTLNRARALLRQTDENVPRALSGWRPTVTVTGSAGLERAKTDNREEQDLTPLAGSLQLTQPIYQGGRTVYGTRQAESEVLADRAFLRTTEQDVLLGTITAYMNVLRDQARVQLTTNNQRVLERQLEATRDRFEVGEVTRTDVAQAEARLSRAVSGRIAAESDLGTSSANYENFVGRAPGDLDAAPPLPDLPQSVQEALGLALVENPELETALRNEDAAKHSVRVAIGSLLPSVSIVGRIDRTDESATEDIGFRSESITAQLTVPLYQSGSVYSDVRRAKELRSQRRVEIEQSRRGVTEDVTSAWEVLVSATSQIESFREEVRANEIALEGVQQESEVGARTVLDVLDAEQELLDAQVNLVIAERDEYVAAYSLIAAMGQLSARNLSLPVELYDPTRHANEVRNKWFGADVPE